MKFLNEEVAKEMVNLLERENSPCPTRKLYYVLPSGRDCDGGYSNGRPTAFSSLESASAFAESCAEGSDGIMYQVCENEAELRQHCEDYSLDFNEVSDSSQPTYDNILND
jgi:hypothetical protein